MGTYATKSFWVIFILSGTWGFSSLGATRWKSVQQQDTLKEVTVTAKEIPGKNKSVNPVQSLNKGQLDKLNSLSVADAVRHFSGVQLKDYGGIGGLKTINVRSLGSNHTGVFYDNIQLGNAQNGQIDLSKFSLDNIESLELYNGQNGTDLQTAKSLASASALYLKTRVPNFVGNERSHGKISIKTGSFGSINPSLLLQQKFSKNIYGSFNVEWQKATGKYRYHIINGPLDSIATRTNTDIEASRIEAGLNGLLRDSSSWSVKAFSYQSQRGLPGAAIRNALSSERLWDKDAFIQSSYKKQVNRQYQWMANAKYSANSSHYVDPEFSNNTIDNKYQQNEFYLSLANQYDFTSYWKASLATDFTLSGMDANSKYFPDPTRYATLIALATNLRINNFEFQGSLLATLVKETVKTGSSATNKQILSPSISGSWRPFKPVNFRLRGFYKNSFRMPSFNDLYYTTIGSTNLKPEYVEQYDLGFTYVKASSGALQYFTFHADGYFNNIKDKIVAIPSGNLFRWSITNLGLVHIYGLETGTNSSWAIGESSSFNLALNYTYQKALDVTPDSYNFNQLIPYTPKHSGAATLGLDIRNYSLNYNYVYTGGRYSLRSNDLINLMQPWYTHDISAAYKYNYHKTTFKILGEINNILDQSYDVVRNFPMPGRSFRLTFAMNY